MTYPVPVATPTAQPTELKLEATSTAITGEFTASESADHYLVLVSKEATPSELPVDKTFYAAGDELGNCQVAYWGVDPKFSYNVAGSTDWNVFVFSANANGLDRPKYLTTSPLTGSIKTLPNEVSYTVEPTSTTSLTLTFKDVPADNKVMVVQTDNFWFPNALDVPLKGAFGDAVAAKAPAEGEEGEGTPEKPLSEAQVGDILNKPAADRALSRPDPEFGGEVIYIGSAAEPLVVEKLAANSYKYFMVIPFTEAEDGKRTMGTVPSYQSGMVMLSPIYQPNTAQWPIGRCPQWWESTPSSKHGEWEAGQTLYAGWTTDGSARTNPSYFYTETNIADQANVENPIISELTVNPIKCDGRHYVATFNLSMGIFNRGSYNAYGDFLDNDLLEFQASTDGGETWETLLHYDKTNAPIFSSWSYNEFKVDLNRYHNGETVLIKIVSHMTKMNAQTRLNYANWMTLSQEEFIAVPEIRIDNDKTTHNSASISWFTTDDTQNKFELQYGKYRNAGGVTTTTSVVLENLTSYELTNLEPETEYYVKVRAIVPVVVEEEPETPGEGDQTEPATAPKRAAKADAEVEWTESEWSDTKYFTTKAIPAPADPTPAEADFTFFQTTKSVILTWEGNDELTKYELQYRTSLGEWSETIETTNTMVILEDLDYDTRYLVRLKAYGEREFESGWIQSNFTTPADDGSGVNAITGAEVIVKAEAGELHITGAAGLAVAVYNLDGSKAAYIATATDNESVSLASGVYVVNVGGNIQKIVVR